MEKIDSFIKDADVNPVHQTPPVLEEAIQAALELELFQDPARVLSLIEAGWLHR